VAAARVNGRFDHAWPLAAQVLAACWPLPDGTLLGARILSNAVHAPYLGEANLLFLLTQMPAPSQPIQLGGHMPLLVYVGFLFYFGLGALVAGLAVRKLIAWRRHSAEVQIPAGGFQFGLWLLLILAGVYLLGFIHSGRWLIPILLAALLPRFTPRTRQPEAAKP
jgi:hypothetical protein